MSFRIQGVQGMQYVRDGQPLEKIDYVHFNQQYASSSYQQEHNMNPSLIVQPRGDEDIIKVIQYATKNNLAIAVKSGGHQYSGASSTGGENIQLDLTSTYKDLVISQDAVSTSPDRQLVLVGVSNQLREFLAYLRAHKLFVPTGQCAFVCVGGHGQTGGYGQLGRSFGLFSDNIRSIRLLDCDGNPQEITKDNNPDRFHAILGGSPGNFGVITHYLVEAYRAESYRSKPVAPYNIAGPYGIKGLWLYRKNTLTALLTQLAKMADDPTVGRNFDFCVSVLSKDFSITKLFPDLKDNDLWNLVMHKVDDLLDDVEKKFLGGGFPAIIAVYAQWCPTSPGDVYNKTVDDWFEQFRDIAESNPLANLYTKSLENQDMSEMTSNWVFPQKREFDLPYVKRTYATNSRTLEKDGWAKAVVDRIDLIFNPQPVADKKSDSDGYHLYKHCKLSVQIQCFGGDNSRFYVNRNNGTSYSWRDSTVVQTLDCFYKTENGDHTRQIAEDWQAQNDIVMNGTNGKKGVFSGQDKRVLWGSWGDWNMGDEKVWKCYYENQEKYEKIGKERGKADPHGTFTPNPFAVTAIRSP